MQKFLETYNTQDYQRHERNANVPGGGVYYFEVRCNVMLKFLWNIR
jgi:hypothetical protein